MDISEIEIGDVFTSNMGSDYTVIEIENNVVLVEFNDKHRHRAVTRKDFIRKGHVKNPYHPTVLGKGYFGVGNYKSSIMDGSKQIRTSEYEAWRGMLKRCYCPKVHKHQPSYIGCSVADEWLNFQIFADWYTKQPGYGEGWDLDKDVLVKGNKVYSKETCVLIPRFLNSLMVDNGPLHDTKGLPRGINYRKDNGQYRVSIGSLSQTGFTKTVRTFKEAIDVRNESTQRRIGEVYHKYGGVIPHPVLHAICERLGELMLIPDNYPEPVI